MKSANQLVVLTIGIVVGVVGSMIFGGPANSLQARTNDRFEDYVMCTGACAVNPRAQSEAVWLLDYKNGRLLGTVIDRSQGRITGWAEADLTGEFDVSGKPNAHFLMTTGVITAGQAALYVAEISSGKFGVYTLGPDPSTPNGVVIRRHDLSSFRRRTAS
ncbi:MAG TPA: hypothetical protein VL371_13655 [Gemmataceae bacterium]|jgi:hypothetical protein|nr:hypothetical protein [Gemmataceae bacterium]